MSETRELTIGSPFAFPFLGHAPYLAGSFPSMKMGTMAQKHGGLWRVKLPNSTFIAVSSARLVDELCDEKRFEKVIYGGQIELRKVVKNGLITATAGDAMWERAHRILLPGFGSKAMGAYLPVMNTVSQRLVDYWHSQVDRPIDVDRSMTMVSLEIIGLCGFGYQFVDFANYTESAFVKKMQSVFSDALKTMVFSDTWMDILFASSFRRRRSTQVLHGVVDDVIQKRIDQPDKDKRDFLNLMLEGVDKKSGETLDAENIRYQLITFLAAGHETTASLLGFCVYYLSTRPNVLEKARDNVDEVFADKTDQELTFKDLSKLGYLKMLVNETLRLWPPGTGFFVGPKADTTLGGHYTLRNDDVLFVSLPGLHRDPEVWGDDAETFNPENFSPEKSKQVPRNAYKPFGNGMRACIGRHFAVTEVLVVLAHLLHSFELIDHQNYQIAIDETVTLKLRNFSIEVKPREQNARAGR